MQCTVVNVPGQAPTMPRVVMPPSPKPTVGTRPQKQLGGTIRVADRTTLPPLAPRTPFAPRGSKPGALAGKSSIRGFRAILPSTLMRKYYPHAQTLDPLPRRAGGGED